jgi:hypothetical protein
VYMGKLSERVNGWTSFIANVLRVYLKS